MLFLAIRMLVGDKLKYFGLLAGMAFAAMMIAQQSSIFSGLSAQTGTSIRELSAIDLWVMDDQVRFSEDSKPMSDTAISRVRGVEGVAWAVPYFKGWLRCRLPDGTRLQVIIVGLDDATLVGGPPNMVDGTLLDLRRDPGVIMDIRDADTKLKLERAGGQPLKVGDRISINDNDAEIVGTYRGSPSFFWDPTLYTTYSRAIRFAPRERNLLSFILVKVKDGEDPAEVARRIEATTPYIARTGPEFEKVTAQYILKQTGILVNFGMAVGLGFVIGLLVTGQTFFNFTLDNLRHFAALKAMGTSTPTLIGMVMVQVLVVTALSFGIGVGVAAALGLVIQKTDLAFMMRWEILALTGVAMLLTGLAAAMLSLWKVLRLEPGVVFKGS
jgi:putative ABC transport system permease protein